MTLPRLHTILNQPLPHRKPAVLDIANLLCSDDELPISPHTSSPISTSTQSRLGSPIHDEYRADDRIHQDQTRYTMHRPTAFRSPTQRQFPSHHTNYAYTPSPPEVYLNRSPSPPYHESSPSPRYSPTIKAKRKRASAVQLDALNRVFAKTFFPSTETRNELARQLGMSPRTVQIWFQNKRQSIRTRERSITSKEKRDDRRYHHSLPTPPLSSAHDGAKGYIDR
jgi:hypothetical protein